MHPVLEAVAQIMPGLSRALGPDCELVLHDFSDIRSSLVAIESSVTGRSLGAPLTDLILRILRHDDSPDDLINYHTSTPDGRPLRSCTLFLRDDEGKPVGCLCFNWDLTPWIAARNLLQEFCQVRYLDAAGSESQEAFVQDVEELLQDTIDQILSKERKPVTLLDKADRVRVVRALDERGVFLIKGAVEDVAKSLNVSRYSVYNYLEEVRAEEQTSGSE